MSKNVKVNGVEYTGVSQVQLPTTAGGTALFKDVDEITTPGGSVTITENGTHNVTNYAQAVVNVASGGGDGDIVGLVDRSISGDIVLPDTVSVIRENMFHQCKNLTSISMPGVTAIENYAFYECTNIVISELPAGLKSIGQWVFSGCKNHGITEIPASLETIRNYVFYQSNTPVLTLKGTPKSIEPYSFAGVTTLNVPWAEGAVANAPWGATNVNYNYTGA